MVILLRSYWTHGSHHLKWWLGMRDRRGSGSLAFHRTLVCTVDGGGQSLVIKMCGVCGIFGRLAVAQPCVLHVHFFTNSICQVELVYQTRWTYCGIFFKYMLSVFVCCCLVVVHVHVLYFICLDLYIHVLLAARKCFPLHYHQLHNTCAIWLCIYKLQVKLIVCWLYPQNGCCCPTAVLLPFLYLQMLKSKLTFGPTCCLFYFVACSSSSPLSIS